MTTDLLTAALKELAAAVAPERLLLCGGFGLILLHTRRSGSKTLMPLVPVRATEDLDLLFTARMVADASRVRVLRDALDRLGYQPVDSAKYYQFARSVDLGGQLRSLKVDLLTAPPTNTDAVKVKARRVRPRGVEHIHARLTQEAVTAHQHPVAIPLGDGVEVDVVHPFTSMLMKLHALRDRIDDESSDFGRRHALDLHRAIAMTTEDDWEAARDLLTAYDADPVLAEARLILHQLFVPVDGRGRLRMAEAARTAGIRTDVDEVAAHLVDWFRRPHLDS